MRRLNCCPVLLVMPSTYAALFRTWWKQMKESFEIQLLALAWLPADYCGWIHPVQFHQLIWRPVSSLVVVALLRWLLFLNALNSVIFHLFFDEMDFKNEICCERKGKNKATWWENGTLNQWEQLKGTKSAESCRDKSSHLVLTCEVFYEWIDSFILCCQVGKSGNINVSTYNGHL